MVPRLARLVVRRIPTRSVVLRRLVLGTLPVLTLLVCSVAPAAAATQSIFVDDATPTASAPLLADGTIATTIYGLLTAPTATASVRVQFRAGDPVAVSLMIPDLAPENALDSGSLPVLRMVTPDGTTTSLSNGQPVRGAQPDPAIGVLSLAGTTETAATAGVYTFTVTAVAPTRFVLSIGTEDGAQGVTSYSEPPSGALEAWNATPPPDAATLGKGSGGGDLDLSRIRGGGVDDSTPGLAAGLPLGIAALAILAVTIVVFIRARGRKQSRPRPPDGAPTPSSEDQFSDGSGG